MTARFEIPRNATPEEVAAVEERAAAVGEARRDGDDEPYEPPVFADGFG